MSKHIPMFAFLFAQIRNLIKTKTKQTKTKENGLRSGMTSEQLTAADLPHITKEDLFRWGVKVFGHRRFLLSQIQQLTQSQTNQGNKDEDSTNK